jgi:hypothetical protein
MLIDKALEKFFNVFFNKTHMRTITLCYRKVVDVNSQGSWEKMVFEDSYGEFKMQAQLFNPEKKFKTFAELLQNNPDAQRLHFLVSPAVVGYLRQLNGIIPDILNNVRKHFLKFSQFHFEIINSNLLDKSKHQIAINFYSEPLTWLDTVGDHLLVTDEEAYKSEVQTQLFQLQPFLTIHSLKQN